MSHPCLVSPAQLEHMLPSFCVSYCPPSLHISVVVHGRAQWSTSLLPVFKGFPHAAHPALGAVHSHEIEQQSIVTKLFNAYRVRLKNAHTASSSPSYQFYSVSAPHCYHVSRQSICGTAESTACASYRPCCMHRQPQACELPEVPASSMLDEYLIHI